MNKPLIVINNEDLRIRPSAIDGFFSCSFQWGKQHLEGIQTMPNSRAAIGTSIHAAAEYFWNGAIESGKKDTNLTESTEAAMSTWEEQTHDGVQFDDGESHGTAAVEIARGASSFIEDIVPFSEIPTGVEQFFEVPIDHSLVSGIGGTIDYLTNDTIADLKTSKRKISAQKHTTQQSIYKWLANKNGMEIEHNLIQGVVLKKASAEGGILKLEPNIDQAKARVNIMLDTLELIATDAAPIEQLLLPNPGHYLCSPKYCAIYPCHVFRGE